MENIPDKNYSIVPASFPRTFQKGMKCCYFLAIFLLIIVLPHDTGDRRMVDLNTLTLNQMTKFWYLQNLTDLKTTNERWLE